LEARGVVGHRPGEGFRVSGCDVHHNHVGIQLTASQACRLSGNTVHHCATNGIVIGKGSADTLVEGNQCHSNSQYGILLYVCRDSRVTGNRVHDNADMGMYFMWGSANIVDRNVLYRNSDGAQFWSSSDNQFVNNVVYGNRVVGVRLVKADPTTGNVIKNCIIAGNGGAGILAQPKEADPQDTFNVFWQNKGDALRGCDPAEGGEGTRVADPQFVSPVDGDFRVLPSSPCVDAGRPAGTDIGLHEQGDKPKGVPYVAPKLADLQNAGFENAGLAGWTCQTADPKRMAIGLDREVARRGAASLRIRKVETEAKVANAGFSQPVRVKPYRHYLITCHVRARDARGWPGVKLYTTVEGEMTATPHRVGTYDWTPVSLAFNSKGQSTVHVCAYAYIERGTVWFDDFQIEEIAPETLGDSTPVDPSPAPAWTEGEHRRGFVTFSRSTLERIYHTCVPRRQEVGRPLSCFATPSEYEPVSLLVHALRPLKDIRVSVGDLRCGKERIPSSRITINVIRPYRLMLDGLRWESVPLFLDANRPTELGAHRTGQWWITIKVPDDAKPGRYRDHVTVQANGGEALRVPLEVEVLPFRLERPDVAYFMYFNHGLLPAQYSSVDYWRKYLVDMREHGMTSITLYHRPEPGPADTSPRPAHLSLDRMMGLVQETKLVPKGTPIVLLSTFPPDGATTKGRGYKGLSTFGAFAGGRRQVMELEAKRKRKGWPEFLYYVVDEPGLPDRIRSAATLFDGIFSSLPVRTTTAIGLTGIRALGPDYDVWITAWLNVDQTLFDLARRWQKEIWLYECWGSAMVPEYVRYYSGVFNWKVGAKGNSHWVYISEKGLGKSHVHPHVTQDGRYLWTDDWQFGYVLPGPDGPISTLGWEAKREGIDDYRYLWTFEQTAVRLRRRGVEAWTDAADEAQKKVDAFLATVHADSFNDCASGYYWTHQYKADPEFKTADYDRLRRLLADEIIRLRRLTTAPLPETHAIALRRSSTTRPVDCVWFLPDAEHRKRPIVGPVSSPSRKRTTVRLNCRPRRMGGLDVSKWASGQSAPTRSGHIARGMETPVPKARRSPPPPSPNCSASISSAL